MKRFFAKNKSPCDAHGLNLKGYVNQISDLLVQIDQATEGAIKVIADGRRLIFMIYR